MVYSKCDVQVLRKFLSIKDMAAAVLVYATCKNIVKYVGCGSVAFQKRVLCSILWMLILHIRHRTILASTRDWKHLHCIFCCGRLQICFGGECV
jgi:hypothetical protein